MTLYAHPGHWAAQLLYLAPVVAMIGALLWARHRAPTEDTPVDEEEEV
jgi:hypothetical protein